MGDRLTKEAAGEIGDAWFDAESALPNAGWYIVALNFETMILDTFTGSESVGFWIATARSGADVMTGRGALPQTALRELAQSLRDRPG